MWEILHQRDKCKSIGMVFLETQRSDFVFDVYKKDRIESFLYITFTQNTKTKTNISKGKGKEGTEATDGKVSDFMRNDNKK